MPKKKFRWKNSQNPAGPIDKPKDTKIAGLSDDTRVIYSEEHNRNDG